LVHIHVQVQMRVTLVGSVPNALVVGVQFMLSKAVDTSATSAPTAAERAAITPLSCAWSGADACASAWPDGPVSHAARKGL
jgi:hypothetical protein